MDLKYLLLLVLVLQFCIMTLVETNDSEKCVCKKSKNRPKKRKSSRRRLKREFTRLQFSDCGGDPDRPMNFHGVDVKPMPVVVPGRVSISLKFNVTRSLLSELGLKVTLSRYLFGIPFSMPCISSGYGGINVGSCVYERICEKLSAQLDENNGCPSTLADKNIPCTCPLDSGEYNLRGIQAHIPKLHGFLGYVVQGDYKIEAELFDWYNKTQLGCLEMKWSIRKKRQKRKHDRKGWFGIARHRRDIVEDV